MVPLERAPLKYIDTWKDLGSSHWDFRMTAGFEQIIFLNVRFWFDVVSDGCLGVISCGEGELTFEAPRDHRTLVPLFPRHRTSNKIFICKTSLGRVVSKSCEKSYSESILIWACPRPHNIFLWASADRYSESSKIVKIFDSRIRILKISDMKKFGSKIFLAYEKSRFLSSNIFRRRSFQFFQLKNNR